MQTERSNWWSGKNIIVILLGISIVYLLFNASVKNRLHDIELNSRAQVSEQQVRLVTIAEATARNGADTVTETTIRDCAVTERVSFEALLDRLDSGLTRSELVELDRLFGRCGNFYSIKKAVMVAKLTREIEMYEVLVNHLNTIVKDDITIDFSVDDWLLLSEMENKQSVLFAHLVNLQDRIIVTLLDGKSVSSEEIKEILHEVNETQETLGVINSQASQIRSSLVPL